MKRREVLNGLVAAAASTLIPFASLAGSGVRQEQYERFRMIRSGMTLGDRPIFTSGWVPVAFEDIGEEDLIRKAAKPEEGMWRVEGCGRQAEGILDVSSPYPSGLQIVDLLNGNLRVPRL